MASSTDVPATRIDHGSQVGRESPSTQARPAVSLKKGVAWNFVATIVAGVAQYGMLMALANFAGAEATGLYGYATALAAPVLAFSGLSLPWLQVTDGGDQFAFSEYLGVRVLTLMVSAPVMIGIILLNSSSRSFTLIALVIALRLSLIALAEIYATLLFRHERFALAARLSIFFRVLNLAAFSVVLIWTGSLLAAVIASCVATFIPLPFLYVPLASSVMRAEGVKDVPWPRMTRGGTAMIIRLAAPLGLIALVESLNVNIPRYFLVPSVGLSGLGVFFILVSLFSVFDQLSYAVSDVISPRLGKFYAQGKKRDFLILLGRAELVGLAVCVAGVAGAALLGPELVSILLSDEYGGYRLAMTLLAAAAGLTVMNRFVVNGITAGRRLVQQVWANTAGLVVLITGCSVLIPRFGIEGAAGAVLLYPAVQLVANTLILIVFVRSWTLPDQTPSTVSPVSAGLAAPGPRLAKTRVR